jgi:hypothetical protein
VAAVDLGRAYLAEESIYLTAQLLSLDSQHLRSGLYILRRSAGRVRAGADADDVVGDVLGALCRLLGAAGDFLGRGALFLDCRGNRSRDLVDFTDDAADRLDRLDGLAGDLLDSLLLHRDGLAPSTPCRSSRRTPVYPE